MYMHGNVCIYIYLLLLIVLVLRLKNQFVLRNCYLFNKKSLFCLNKKIN